MKGVSFVHTTYLPPVPDRSRRNPSPQPNPNPPPHVVTKYSDAPGNSDQYLGRLATGKIVSGVVVVGMPVKTLGRLGGGEQTGPHKVGELFVTRGVTREPLGATSAGAGDIVTVAGAE